MSSPPTKKAKIVDEEDLVATKFEWDILDRLRLKKLQAALDQQNAKAVVDILTANPKMGRFEFDEFNDGWPAQTVDATRRRSGRTALEALLNFEEPVSLEQIKALGDLKISSDESAAESLLWVGTIENAYLEDEDAFHWDYFGERKVQIPPGVVEYVASKQDPCRLYIGLNFLLDYWRPHLRLHVVKELVQAIPDFASKGWPACKCDSSHNQWDFLSYAFQNKGYPPAILEYLVEAVISTGTKRAKKTYLREVAIDGGPQDNWRDIDADRCGLVGELVSSQVEEFHCDVDILTQEGWTYFLNFLGDGRASDMAVPVISSHWL